MVKYTLSNARSLNDVFLRILDKFTSLQRSLDAINSMEDLTRHRTPEANLD